MKRTPLATMSLQKIAQLNAEVETRKALARRAGGLPVLRKVTICRHEGVYHYTAVRCLGGKCEYCGRPCDELEPHEKIFRSQGGSLSLDNTLMVCRGCHRQIQNNDPLWGNQ